MNKSYLSFLKDYDRQPTPSRHFSLLQHRSTSQTLLLREQYLQNTTQLKTTLKTLDLHIALQHQYILPLRKYFVQQGVTPCLTMVFEAGLHSLAEEVQARKEQNKHFRENEIWAILYGIVAGMGYLQRVGVPCGDLAMDAIFLTDNGKAKIVSPCFVQTITSLKKSQYYSPQEVSHLFGSETLPNIYKTNVFIAALCVLQCCLLESNFEYFNSQTGCVDFDLLEYLLEETSHHYSEDLVRLLVDMLDEEVDTRPHFLQLQSHISKICTFEEHSQQASALCLRDEECPKDACDRMDEPDEVSLPDMGEGIEEDKETQFKRLELHPLQISINNLSSVETRNPIKAFGLEKIKHVKIADSLSYSGLDMDNSKLLETSYAVDSPENPNKQNNTKTPSDGKQTSGASRSPLDRPDASCGSLPFNSQIFDNRLPTYSYISSTSMCPIQIPKTDSSGLFTSPQLLSFIKGQISSLTNQNSNPN